MEFKGIHFKITSMAGYPARIGVLVNNEGVVFMYQRFLVPNYEAMSRLLEEGWVHLKTFRDKSLIEREMGFRDVVFMNVLKAYASLLDEWNDKGELNMPEDETTYKNTRFTADIP